MNSLNIIFCHECLERLRDFGCVSEYIFKNITTDYFKDNIQKSSQFMRSHQMLCEFLESKGYIVSTECDKENYVYRPNGIFPQAALPLRGLYSNEFLNECIDKQQMIQNYYICIDPCDHDFDPEM
jgi:hypothetical protein